MTEQAFAFASHRWLLSKRGTGQRRAWAHLLFLLLPE